MLIPQALLFLSAANLATARVPEHKDVKLQGVRFNSGNDTSVDAVEEFLDHSLQFEPLGLGMVFTGSHTYMCRYGQYVFQSARGNMFFSWKPGHYKNLPKGDGDASVEPWRDKAAEFNMTRLPRDTGDQVHFHVFTPGLLREQYEMYEGARKRLGMMEPTTHQAFGKKMEMTGEGDLAEENVEGLLDFWIYKAFDPHEDTMLAHGINPNLPTGYEGFWEEKGTTNWMFTGLTYFTGIIDEYTDGWGRKIERGDVCEHEGQEQIVKVRGRVGFWKDRIGKRPPGCGGEKEARRLGMDICGRSPRGECAQMVADSCGFEVGEVFPPPRHD